MTLHNTKVLPILLALVGAATIVRAQNVASPCATAVSRARTLAPANLRGRSADVDRLSSCGRDGAAVVGDLFRSARASHDMELLGQLLSYSTGPDGLVLLEPLLTVAEDRDASTEARVTAMLGLLNLKTGRGGVGYRDVTGGFDVTGEPARACGTSRTVTDQGGSPRATPADAARIVGAAKRIRSDSTAPIDVRTAAACLAG